MSDTEAEDRAAATRRDVRRLRSVLDGWATMASLNVNPRREEILAGLAEPDRQLVRAIERVIDGRQTPKLETRVVTLPANLFKAVEALQDR